MLKSVGHRGRHRVGRDLGGSDLGDHFPTSGTPLIRALQLALHADRLGQTGSGMRKRVHRKCHPRPVAG